MIGPWRGVEPRHLAALAAVGETGSFRGAAERLGYVQSAISQQVAQLESALGTSLVRRARGGQIPLAMTEAGAMLVEHADEILSQLEAAAADLGALRETRVSLHVGVDDSVAARLLPDAIRRFGRRQAGVTIVAHDGSDEHAHAQAIRRGDLDAAVAERPLAKGSFDVQEIGTDPIMLVVPSDSPLARGTHTPTIEQIAGLPLVASTSWRMLNALEARVRAAGLEPRFEHFAGLSSSVHASVVAGIAYALLPRLAVDATDPRVTAIDLGEMFPPRRLVLYWNRHRRLNGELVAFCESLRETCASLDQPARLDGATAVAVA